MARVSQRTERVDAPDPTRRVWLAVVLLVVATVAVYWNSYRGPFILDDLPAITENATLRDLADLRAVLSPPGDGQTVSGRPLINLSLALNWAISGEHVWSYHAFNVLIHLLAGLTLFGVVRRTLLLPALCPRFGDAATTLAFAVALLWLVHPLQTESVTYVVQRAESVVGVFYLLTLYAFIRSVETTPPASGRARPGWSVVAFIACLAGMASKEVMVSAPLFVLLYDRTLVAGSFREALRRRWPLHAALFATWVLLAWLVLDTGTRGSTAGFGLGISPVSYALKQAEAVVHYLRLSVWPSPLVLDYGFDIITSPAAVWPQLMVIAALVGATVFALVRRSPLALPGVWFFAILAPSSSIVPVATQTMAEHRMYLPLAAVAVGVALLVHRLANTRGVWIASAVAGVALGAATVTRNTDYASAIRIWTDTTTKRPANARAHHELAQAYAALGDHTTAVVFFARCEALMPDAGKFLINHANSLAALGRVAEAAPRYERALRALPRSPDAHYNYANLLAVTGHLPEAITHLREAIRLNPRMHVAHHNLGTSLAILGRPLEAAAAYEEALRIAPGFVDAHFNLGNTYATLGRNNDALAQFQATLALAPGHAQACANIGVLLFLAGRRDEGIGFLERAVQLAPADWELRAKLATARAEAGAR